MCNEMRDAYMQGGCSRWSLKISKKEGRWRHMSCWINWSRIVKVVSHLFIPSNHSGTAEHNYNTYY
jgi:hypothetical protein